LLYEKKNNYDLKPGDFLKRKFNGKEYILKIKGSVGKLEFEVSGKTFNSLTAAAKFVKQNDSEISGPAFWKAPKKAD